VEAPADDREVVYDPEDLAEYGPDEVRYPEWMEKDPVTGEVPE
jgi:hypothetical protein